MLSCESVICYTDLLRWFRPARTCGQLATEPLWGDGILQVVGKTCQPLIITVPTQRWDVRVRASQTHEANNHSIRSLVSNEGRDEAWHERVRREAIGQEYQALYVLPQSLPHRLRMLLTKLNCSYPE
jgi:hypothetical protein